MDFPQISIDVTDPQLARITWIAVLTGRADGYPDLIDSTTFYISASEVGDTAPIDPCSGSFRETEQSLVPIDVTGAENVGVELKDFNLSDKCLDREVSYTLYLDGEVHDGSIL